MELGGTDHAGGRRGRRGARLGGAAVAALLLVGVVACSEGGGPTDDAGGATEAGGTTSEAGRATTGSPFATSDEPVVEAPDERFIVDDGGRVLILRGQNVIGAAKQDPERTGGVDEDEIAQLSDRFGHNVSRHLIFWDAVEPEPGVYDEAYLDRVEERLDWYAAHGIHVFLDMHQDLYSIEFGGDGAPAWAVHTDGLEFGGIEEGAPWWLAAADPAVEAAYANFWDPERGHPELQEHYRDMWVHVVERFADHPAVIGYDLMNEPTWSLGSLNETLAFALVAKDTGDWENERLIDFTQMLIDAMRPADADGYLLVEPTSVVNADVDLGDGFTGPFPGDLAPFDDPREGPSRLVYAPHFYPIEVHEGLGYSPDNPYLTTWERLRSEEATRFVGGALFIGEFGANLDEEGANERYFGDVLDMADRQMAGWAYWSWDLSWWGIRSDDGADAPHADFVVRPYPHAIAGTPEAFSYDPGSRIFRLTYATREGVRGPTEVYLATERHFPEGVEVTVTGDAEWNVDEDREVLLVDAAAGAGTITVCVTPKGVACE